MQYTTSHAYSKDIYTYEAYVDRGPIATHLYRRGVRVHFLAQKKEGGRYALFRLHIALKLSDVVVKFPCNHYTFLRFVCKLLTQCFFLIA